MHYNFSFTNDIVIDESTFYTAFLKSNFTTFSPHLYQVIPY